jgi:hypothetical protein
MWVAESVSASSTQLLLAIELLRVLLHKIPSGNFQIFFFVHRKRATVIKTKSQFVNLQLMKKVRTVADRERETPLARGRALAGLVNCDGVNQMIKSAPQIM